MKEIIGLGGGCHWCTEAVFSHLRGVLGVEQGWISAEPPHHAFSEAVRVTFDPSFIPLEALIEVHLRTHAATSDHSMRGKYRSAVYATTPEQLAEIQRALVSLQAEFEKPLITGALMLSDFRLNEPQFLNYYASDSEKPFCKVHINPKLALLREEFRAYAKSV